MKNYTVQPGDTLNSIAIKFLYRAALSYKIRQINNLPGNDVYPGQVLLIPEIEKTERKEYRNLTIIVDGKELKQTPPVTIQTAINTIAPGFNFEIPIHENLKIFKPYGYEFIDIYYGNTIILSGYVDSIVCNSLEKTLSVSGFGASHVLSQVNFPPASYPRTFYNSTLKKIIEKVIDPFQVQLEIEEDAKSLAGKKFPKVEISASQKISDFIIDLADQKGLIIHGNSTGGIVLKNELTNSEKILKLVDIPGTVEYNNGSIFSDYTCLKNADSTSFSKIARSKIKIDVFRPTVFEAGNLQDDSLENMIKKHMKADLINSHKMTISLPYVTDINGDLIDINRQISYKNDDIFADDDYVITAVTYDFSATEEKATLDIVPVKYLKGEL